MNRLGVRGKWFMAMGLLFCLVAWWTPALAQEAAAPAAAPEAKKEEAPAEDKPTASLGVDILSQYIWRGLRPEPQFGGVAAVIDRRL